MASSGLLFATHINNAPGRKRMPQNVKNHSLSPIRNFPPKAP